MDNVVSQPQNTSVTLVGTNKTHCQGPQSTGTPLSHQRHCVLKYLKHRHTMGVVLILSGREKTWNGHYLIGQLDMIQVTGSHSYIEMMIYL